MESMIDNTDLADSVDLAFNGDQINLQIDGRFLFESGQAELKERARFIFSNLAQMFREQVVAEVAGRRVPDSVDVVAVAGVVDLDQQRGPLHPHVVGVARLVARRESEVDGIAPRGLDARPLRGIDLNH